MKIAALVSGGVDSSVMVYLLKRMGYDPHIFYIRIALENEPGYIDCPSEEDIEITNFIARKYNCRFDVVDLKEEYWNRVITYTLDTVKAGFTPNPDIMCNKLIKFGSFEDKYGKDFDHIATGHYARVFNKDGLFHLGTAKDRKKDQTYFLGQLSSDQVSKMMTPAGEYLKQEIRDLAHKENLPSASRKDSQGICFLGKINYNDFIRKYAGEKEGDVIELETGKMLGKHKGIWFHTIGQRRGLGFGQGPWFVVRKDIDANIIYVSNGYDPDTQYDDKINLKDFHFIHDVYHPGNGVDFRIKYKIRHQPEFTGGQLNISGDKAVILSDERISGIAPGQFAVVYDWHETYCLGSGLING